MNEEQIIKSSEEQAIASWTNYLNQVRLDRFSERLCQFDINYDAADEMLKQTFSDIKALALSNRGGDKGIHGFIAEIAECGIGNARALIKGQAAEYLWINDNGPVDLMRAGVEIQQKFVQSGGHLSLGAVLEHMQKYPDFLSGGGKYQIPKDHFEKISEYLSMPKELANKLPHQDFRQWKEVHSLFESGKIDINSLEGSLLDYSSVQRDAIEKTLEAEGQNLKKLKQQEYNAAYLESKPSLSEGASVAALGAAAEGLTALFLEIRKKRKSGTSPRDFTLEDWLSVLKATGLGAATGGVRSTGMYILSNYTSAPSFTANAIMSSAFGVAEQLYLFRSGKIDEATLIENSEILCLDAAVSAVSSLIGQTVFPVPFVGAVLGNAVGMLFYQIGKDTFSRKEQQLLEQYLNEIRELEAVLDADYSNLLKRLKDRYDMYIELLMCAFHTNPSIALDGSVALARYWGVPLSECLDSRERITEYFLY